MEPPSSPIPDASKVGDWLHSSPFFRGVSTDDVAEGQSREEVENAEYVTKVSFSSTLPSSVYSSGSFSSRSSSSLCVPRVPSGFSPTQNASPHEMRTAMKSSGYATNMRNPDFCCSACGRPLESEAAASPKDTSGGLRRPAGAAAAAVPPTGGAAHRTGAGMGPLEDSEGENTATEWGLDTDPEAESYAGEMGGRRLSSSGPLRTACSQQQGPAHGAAMHESSGSGLNPGSHVASARKGDKAVEESCLDEFGSVSDRLSPAVPVSAEPACLRQRRISPTDHQVASVRDGGAHRLSRPRSSVSSSASAGSVSAVLLRPFKYLGLWSPAYGRSRSGLESPAFGVSHGGADGPGAGLSGIRGGLSSGLVSRTSSSSHLPPVGQSSVQLEADRPLEKKLETFRVRSLWTLILVFIFVVILAAGHVYSAGLVLALVASMYWEIIAVKQKREEARLPDFYLLKWYWFLITIMGFGLPSVLRMPWRPCASLTSSLGGAGTLSGDIDEAGPSASSIFGRTARRFLERLLTFHSLVTYTAGFIGLVWFILSLRKGSMRYQFSQLGVMLVALVFIVGQALMQIANIYSGLIWFILPTSLVIVNDVSAYICGMLFGRTRLIRLSPKKTVEGFVGASFITLLWAVIVAKQLQEYKVFVCPPRMIDFRPFAMWHDLDCKVPDAFVPRCYDEEIESFLGLKGWLTPPEPTPQEVAQLQQVGATPGPLQGAGDGEALSKGSALEKGQGRKAAGRGSVEERRRVHPADLASSRSPGEDERGKEDSVGRGEVEPEETEEVSLVLDKQQAVAVSEGSSQEGRSLSKAALGSRAPQLPARSLASCRFYFSPFQFHSIVLGLFAGFLAPFGGFFASGFKRAARIKDFGEIIPGHGGVTDRFDCQILTGMFTHLYYTSFVYSDDASEPEAEPRRRLPRHTPRGDTLHSREKTENDLRDYSEGGVDSTPDHSICGEKYAEPSGAAPHSPQRVCLQDAGNESGGIASPDARGKLSEWKAKTGAELKVNNRKAAATAAEVDRRDKEKMVLAAVASMEDAEELERVKALVVARLADLERRRESTQLVQGQTEFR
ncbi:phosphatidate cytidylyltransferase [Toxoplasma gondii RUB]|uniref:Phosphatidate cytidylyltransferase n=3 Tax=Toxoplasma gondii TaxID=5811 RepID=A0A086LLC7_TOXGO|nr:phosphatidate cytidylyltransferase [Toxoplasma gondii p89]KFG57445.1 phosphatidate cytidylyltransferase [Toxoplasma gondii RUB]PUA84019.1 phosphatidate cytidylyltransferase [Toxoplasma gondii TgCATBr9]